MNQGRFRIQVRRVGPAGAWYWRVVGRNNRVLLTSETYATRSNARRAALAFAGDPPRALFLRIQDV